jgi:hypothetical protein
MEQRPNQPVPMAMEDGLRDLRSRTLAKLDGDFARLIYLASTRDYNTGRYAHDGLSFRYSEPVAERVLAQAHREVFVSLALSPLKILVTQLEQYIRTVCAHPGELLATWQKLEPFRILAPDHDDPVTVKLFISNIRVALAIVGASSREHQRH